MLKPEELRESLLARRNADEQSLQIENDDVLNALDDAGRRELESIRRALARMDSGDYGICAACGEPIAPARLRALPTAELCIRCAERRGI
jgi:RNA polymerase-binding transcription factor DksA